MTNQQKNQILSRHWFLAKTKLLKRIPKLLNNNKLFKRRAKASSRETCISQNSDPQNCKTNLR
jgi:hypothetical protein